MKQFESDDWEEDHAAFAEEFAAQKVRVSDVLTMDIGQQRSVATAAPNSTHILRPNGAHVLLTQLNY